MDAKEIAISATKLILDEYMEWKFDRLYKKAVEHGLSVEELSNSDERFALFMRAGRAFEVCSNKDSVDFIADAMIGGIKKGDIDTQPDRVHMAVGSLTGITKAELNVLVLMQKHDLYSSESDTAIGGERKKIYEYDACERLGIDAFRLGALTNGLMRTGLVTPPAMNFGSYSQNTNALTCLARDLFDYVYYVKRPQ